MKHLTHYILALALLFSIVVNATSLRGRVVAYNSYYNSYYPASGVSINIVSWNGNAWVSVTRTVTQRDGMYYLNLHPGQYYVQAPGVNIPIVVHPRQYQDIPQITIRH